MSKGNKYQSNVAANVERNTVVIARNVMFLWNFFSVTFNVLILCDATCKTIIDRQSNVKNEKYFPLDPAITDKMISSVDVIEKTTKDTVFEFRFFIINVSKKPETAYTFFPTSNTIIARPKALNMSNNGHRSYAAKYKNKDVNP